MDTDVFIYSLWLTAATKKTSTLDNSVLNYCKASNQRELNVFHTNHTSPGDVTN